MNPIWKMLSPRVRERRREQDSQSSEGGVKEVFYCPREFFFLFLHMMLFVSCDILVFYGHHWLLFSLIVSIQNKIFLFGDFYKSQNSGYLEERERPINGGGVSQGRCTLFLDLHDGRRSVNLILSYAFVLWGFCFCALYFMIKSLKIWSKYVKMLRFGKPMRWAGY